jgi:hypothetical protein
MKKHSATCTYTASRESSSLSQPLSHIPPNINCKRKLKIVLSEVFGNKYESHWMELRRFNNTEAYNSDADF